MSVISMKQLLEAGVHFGHQTRRWNPKMAPYIFTERNGIHIIDLQKSVGKVDEAYRAVFEIAQQGGTILFVGTKKQAQDAVKAEAERCGMYYVNGDTLAQQVRFSRQPHLAAGDAVIAARSFLNEYPYCLYLIFSASVIFLHGAVNLLFFVSIFE